MFQQIGKVEHEEALQHEPRELTMKNKKTSLQTIMERSKHLVGRPKLQPHMTLQSLGKCINQESEGTSN